jgi:hypothetical protein
MSKLMSLSAIILVALALAACGGGGENPADVATKVTPDVGTTTPVSVADLTFVNVPTDSRKTSVIPGERDVELAAFRVEGINTPLEQLIFSNKTTAPGLSLLFKRTRLIASNGNDVSFESSYTVSIDDKKGTITLDFTYQWVPVDSGMVPMTYSLVAEMNPGAKPDTTFSFELTGAQTHAFGKTVAFEVKGGELQVKPVAGMDLPVLTTASPASSTTTSSLGDKEVEMGSFKASCPEKNDAPCSFENIKYKVCGMSQPVLRTDGLYGPYSWWSGYGVFIDGYYAPTASIGYEIKPGETKTFTIFATPYSANLRLNVIDTEWKVGEESVKVSPVISTASVLGSLLETNSEECPPVSGSGKG